MIVPYDHLLSLFEINQKAEVFFEEDVIYIDNFYKNYDEIYEVLTNMPVPRWKWMKGPSENFSKYYDCRPVIKNNHVGPTWMGGMKWVTSLIERFYGSQPNIILSHPDYEFNYFKHIDSVPDNNEIQFHPHHDTPFASIIYLDKVCSGGTAIYDIDGSKSLINKEGENLLKDVSQWARRIIEAKPNRHIIFRGTNPHGGFIEDHSKYLNDWRINQVMFYELEGYDHLGGFDVSSLRDEM